jgi:histidinol-phosphate/aromatic aminotransferase/cobyric acid decarboxylase-like protein
VRALQDPDYYAARWRDTRALRDRLAADLSALGSMRVLPGVANFVLCDLDPAGPPAADVVAACRELGVFLRDAGDMGTTLGTHAVRVAVKDEAANRRIVEALRAATR